MRFEHLKAFFYLYRDLYSKYKLKFGIIVLLSFLNGLAGSIGVVILVPLFALLVKNSSQEDNLVSRAVSYVFGYFGWEPSLWSLLALIVSLFFLKAVALYFFVYLNSVIGLELETDLKKRFYENTFSTSWPYLIKQKVGYLEYALTTDLSTTTKILNTVSYAVLHFVSFAMYLATVLYLSFFVTVTAAGLGIIILLFSKLAMKKVKKYANSIGLLKRSMSHFINESIVGLKTIKILRVEPKMVERLENLLGKYRNVAIKTVKLHALMSQPIEPLGYIFISIVFAAAYSRPDFNLAAFAVTVYLIHRLFLYIEKFQDIYRSITNSIPYAERTMALKNDLALYKERDEGPAPFLFRGALEFKGVHFAYEERDSVLSGINFAVRKGEAAAIVGPSGAGKTTIADLIMRLLLPQKGVILIDGADIAKINLKDWRRSIGYVSQDIFLKNDTIEQNIKFYDDGITDTDMISAARAANIYDFIEDLPGKFSAVVGERGIFLSTGQRQRIALARVLARRPEILILDEATSSLDNESEAAIKKAIDKLKGEITIIIIAHRLSTVIDADKVIALLDGRVEEIGNPRELLNDANSYFYKVYNIAR